MKKLNLILLALAASVSLQAQWVDDPATNTFLSDADSWGNAIYLATDADKGDIYIQWTQGFSNGYGPALQHLTFEGVPTWGDEGMHITGHGFPSSSDGFAMTVTTDHAVVTCFATNTDQTYAVKIREDGTYAWGEQGVMLFDGQGFSRTEVVAGTDGGVWALGFDYHQHFLQYVEADGTLNPVIRVAAEGYNVMFGKLTLGFDNDVFLTYEQLPENSQMWSDKEIYLVGYNRNGGQVVPPTLLMSSQSFQMTYRHYVVPDGLDGGYAYIWHSGIDGKFNTYVFHYDANGNSTIDNTIGATVHSADPMYEFLDAYGSVDPNSHDLIIAYRMQDASYASTICVNRISPTGERLWGDGYRVTGNTNRDYENIMVNVFEDASGFIVIYQQSSETNPYNSTIEAVAMDMDGNRLWEKTLSSSAYRRVGGMNNTGFCLGQSVIAWINAVDGGLYGQNITPDGTMGVIDPVYPNPIPSQSGGPENFEGVYIYDLETETYGVKLSWTTQYAENPDYYLLTRTNLTTGEEQGIEIAGEAFDYFDETGIGSYKYVLRAAFEDYGLTLPATTPDGEDYVIVEVTGIEENLDDEIVTIVKIFNANGQSLQVKDLNELNTGLYILQGLTKDGRTVNRKVVVNK